MLFDKGYGSTDHDQIDKFCDLVGQINDKRALLASLEDSISNLDDRPPVDVVMSIDRIKKELFKLREEFCNVVNINFKDNV